MIDALPPEVLTAVYLHLDVRDRLRVLRSVYWSIRHHLPQPSPPTPHVHALLAPRLHNGVISRLFLTSSDFTTLIMTLPLHTIGVCAPRSPPAQRRLPLGLRGDGCVARCQGHGRPAGAVGVD